MALSAISAATANIKIKPGRRGTDVFVSVALVVTANVFVKADVLAVVVIVVDFSPAS
jgi:hypothetical protein